MNFIKYFIYSVIALALVGCSKDSIEETSGVSTKMKTVTISSGIEEITRASVNSQTGAFTWQSGDLISVLATDGKFYDFSGELAAPGGAYCIPWDEMEEYDALLYKRIIRDCVM